tara:strand:+ start:87084 stop:87839 length:756 start_codon:yes stop_codon:yes gene_type:complete
MIKFFRHIRKSLLMENKTSKYFKYAIGEIVLVVIGILIALQINNANDTRKEKKVLHQYLAKISNNLDKDIKNLKDIRERRLTVIKDCQTAVKNFHENKFNLGANMKAAQVFVDFYFVPIQSGYEALKNSSYLGEINGTEVDSFLDSYHLILNKILDEESSYLTYIENMEVLWTSSFDMSELLKVYQKDIENIRLQDFDMNLQKKLIAMFEHESFRSTVTRGSFQTNMLTFYDELIDVGNKVIQEIEIYTND